MRRRSPEPPRGIPRDVYLAWRCPRVGMHNPHRMTNVAWSWLASNPELSAYQANARFRGPSSLAVGPAWCAQRFGQSTTKLDDTRTVRIGGEHEDHYDADFFIYNDVIVDEPNGAVAIYGYPYDAFEPTDFHTATLVGSRIVIIGSLGYPARRRIGATPVATLDLTTWKMSPLPAAGAGPGWLHKHEARLDGELLVVSRGLLWVEVGGEHHFIDSADDWSLDLRTDAWSRLTYRQWTQWELKRTDGKSNELWRRALAYQFATDKTPASDFMFEGIGDPADVFAKRGPWEARYAPPLAHEALPGNEDVVPAVHRRLVEGVVVRYVEESYAVRVVIEGPMDADAAALVVADASEKLSALEDVPYASKRVTLPHQI